MNDARKRKSNGETDDNFVQTKKRPTLAPAQHSRVHQQQHCEAGTDDDNVAIAEGELSAFQRVCFSTGANADSDGDLLQHLDSQREREWCDRASCTHVQRQCRDDSTTQRLRSYAQNGLNRLQAASKSADCATGRCGDANDVELRTDRDDDLLKRLDIKRRREQIRLAQRRYRARQRQKMTNISVCDVPQDLRMTRPTTTEGGQRKMDRKKNHSSEQIEVASHDYTSDVEFDNDLSEQARLEVMKILQTALGAEGLEECVCVVCDRVVLCTDARRKVDTDWQYMEKMKSVLRVAQDDLPDGLQQCYRPPPPHLPLLDGITISPRGIHCFDDETSTPRAWFSVCMECDRSIGQTKLPKFAIANGFCIGRLPPPLRKLTLPERFVTQLVSMMALSRVMRGGRHRCIRSHCIAFDCTPAPPILLLPRSIRDVDSFRVVMVGEFTPVQAEKVRKLHRIRNCKVRGVFRFYKASNQLYAGVVENDSALQTCSTDISADQLFVDRVDDPDNFVNVAMEREQENIRGQAEGWRVRAERDEQTVLERRIGLCDRDRPVHVREIPIPYKEGVHEERKFEVRRSNQLSNDACGDLFGRMFPHLFPFGRGHPGENRIVPVSLQECVKYYLRLSERQFAEDELFALVAFDRLALRIMYIQNQLRCRRFPHTLNGYESLTSEALGRALLQNERRRKGCLPWQLTPDTVAQRFLKSVEIGARSVWGSNAERAQYRHKAFAYQTRFGNPALFVTLTPNTDNSLVLGHYAGVSSVAMLFDLLDSRLPSMSELREASLKNDSASARLFIRHVDAFIRYALGINPKTKKKLACHGLFGDTKAYFGMVESQGRGTLHVHFLIWLNGCPANSTAVERILSSLKGQEFQQRVAAFAERIVTTNLPIGEDQIECSSCGGKFSALIGLPKSAKTRKDPLAGIRSSRSRLTVSEPALIQCGICESKFSSQHLLRSTLLILRPNYWPPQERALTSAEIEEQATNEAICRDTKRQAMEIVTERETSYASFSGTDMAMDRGAETTGLFKQANSTQMAYCKIDDDPFRNDNLTRLFEISPPSSFDARLSRTSVDYMVSALAVQLNQHMWSHTSSCFKQSRATANDSYCRYRYPRERVEETSFDAAGIQLRRALCHEFMNGFNYELMATFRCNHDIQLLGGKDISDRIHYCCKYVTKQQKRLDSQVAVAVAAFKTVRFWRLAQNQWRQLIV